ncbi:hypothetical protein ACH42_15970 [Endozoicomonas sp. (ex Bugula neritina AB1)]|nr:hypothetical protein ACH42_15970 [Endozoicomonas sp. (ex Bugula neritina AB1)]
MNQGTRHTVRLLIVDSESGEAEAILNVFRDAGHATRGQHITSANSLEKALSERRKWDLVLISELPEGLSITSIVDIIAQQGKDIPVVVLADYLDERETLELIKQGVRAVVPRDSDEHLLLTSNKEIENLRVRRHYRRMSVALNESEKQRRMLLDDQIDAVLYINDGIVRYANPAFRQMLGVNESVSLVGESFKNRVAPHEREEVEEFLINVEDNGQAVAAIQCSLMDESGQQQPIRAVIAATSFEGEYTLSLLVRPDHSTEEGEGVGSSKVEKAAAPNDRTGLFDKAQFQEQLDFAIQKVMADKGGVTLMCITLDSLKAIHKKGGRKISQPMLLAVAQKISNQLADQHQATSWGNGLFMVLLSTDDNSQVQQIANDILGQVGEKIEIGTNTLPVRLSLGAVPLSDTNNDPKTLLVLARHAATQASKEGGNKLSFYQARKVDVVSSVEKHLAGMVSQALKNDSMQLLYQPVVSLKGLPEEYYDVFLRMTDIRGRQHEAASFRTKLDKNALWGKVDRWQLIQASKDLMAKRKDGSDTRLILHIGACAITDESFVPWLGVALKAAGIPAEAVVLELSEPNLVRFGKDAQTFFRAVKKMGCQTGVSDFGCSLNPLETIEPLDIDLVRVDPSFTQGITRPNKSVELEKMIEALGQKQCKIIVSQVESVAEMTPLWQSGVDFIQGSFLQSPSKEMTFDFGSDI